MEKLTRDEVLHVAELARIEIDEDEIEKYQIELKQLLNDVEKINDVVGYDDNILIACWNQDTTTRVDEEGDMLEVADVIKNAPHHSGGYIEVPVVIKEED